MEIGSLVLENILKFMKEIEQIAGSGTSLKIEDNKKFVTINFSGLDAGLKKERLLKLIERLSPHITLQKPDITNSSRWAIPDENVSRKEILPRIKSILILEEYQIEIELA